jgi:hypothetical protein
MWTLTSLVRPGDLVSSAVWEAPPALKPTGPPETVDLSHYCDLNDEKQPKPKSLSLLEWRRTPGDVFTRVVSRPNPKRRIPYEKSSEQFMST